MSEPRRAFVLAAGLGTRLRPLTDELPKPAWPFFDVPLAVLVLQALADAGVEEVIVNLHHLGPCLTEALTPWIPHRLNVLWSHEEVILGTGGALVPWRERLSQGPFFLCNADTLQDVDLGHLARFHEAHTALATLVLRPVEPGAKAPIEIDEEGRIVRFLASRAPGSSPGTPCEFTGIHRLEPEVLGELPEGRFCINADVHARLVAEGKPLFGYVPPGDAFWSDLGTPERYLGAHRAYLALGRLPPGAPGHLVLGEEETAEGGKVVGPSYVGPTSRIERGATAGPWAVVGSGAVLGDGGRVESSVLWPRSRVEGETVRNTILSAAGNRLGPVRQV